MADTSLGRTAAYAELPITVDLASVGEVALGATIAAPLPVIEGEATVRPGSTTMSVLPRVEPGAAGARLVPTEGPRYKQIKKLGEGGMGEVALVEDRDIGRSVALKRLVDHEQSAPAIARFVDEVRTIGNLEHPNIVPIHDVGVDEAGRFFFVMKFVDGETLESIIERLAAGDPKTIAQYPVQRRIEIFIGLLRALQFAHSRNLIHRDVKSANVMVGRYGEVVLMDWGIARPIGARGARTSEGGTMSEAEMHAPITRASETHHGALIGTPLYMSPEQASGQNESLDARSDLYSACLLFHELLGLAHRRGHHTSLAKLIAAAQTEEAPPVPNMFAPHAANPNGVAPELRHFLHRGLAREREHRWQSAEQMILELERILEGRVRVQCPATLSKRMTREAGRFVDRYPRIAMVLYPTLAVLFLALFLNAVRDLVRAL